MKRENKHGIVMLNVLDVGREDSHSCDVQVGHLKSSGIYYRNADEYDFEFQKTR